jgi:hypothetical protein
VRLLHFTYNDRWTSVIDPNSTGLPINDDNVASVTQSG